MEGPAAVLRLRLAGGRVDRHSANRVAHDIRRTRAAGLGLVWMRVLAAHGVSFRPLKMGGFHRTIR